MYKRISQKDQSIAYTLVIDTNIEAYRQIHLDCVAISSEHIAVPIVVEGFEQLLLTDTEACSKLEFRFTVVTHNGSPFIAQNASLRLDELSEIIEIWSTIAEQLNFSWHECTFEGNDLIVSASMKTQTCTQAHLIAYLQAMQSVAYFRSLRVRDVRLRAQGREITLAKGIL